jgi:integrase
MDVTIPVGGSVTIVLSVLRDASHMGTKSGKAVLAKRRHLWPACVRLGIRRFGWHSLRHTFSTYNGNAGVAVPVLQSLRGHASAETTMVCTHALEDVKRKAVETLAGILFPNVPSERKLIAKGRALIR